MNRRFRYFSLGDGLIRFRIEPPLEAAGCGPHSLLEVAIEDVRTWTPQDESCVMSDHMSQEELEAVIQGHLEQGFVECDSHGRPQMPPPPSLTLLPPSRTLYGSRSFPIPCGRRRPSPLQGDPHDESPSRPWPR